MKKFFLLLLLSSLTTVVTAAETVKMAVASNMSEAMTEITEAFKGSNPIKTSLSFGSSGNFTRQIIQGAPYRIFLSADKKYVDILRENKVSILDDIEYVRGRIGLFIPDGSSLAASTDLKSAINKMSYGHYRRLVIANPEHAPYGLAAREALHNAGLWVVAKQGLLLAENVAQAAQIAVSGDVDAGVISASHALMPGIKDRGKFFLIPEQWHQPLQQHLLLLGGADDADTSLFNFLQNDFSRQVIVRYGYSMNSPQVRGVADGLAGP